MKKNCGFLISMALCAFLFSLISCQSPQEDKKLRSSKVEYKVGDRYYSTISYYNRTGNMKEERQIINAPRLNRRMISRYNLLGQETSLRVYDKDSLLIMHDNFYGDRQELISEYRIEYGDDNDTFQYEYHYIATDSSKPVEYFRTNNGDTVAKFTEIFKGDTIIEISQTFPVEDSDSKSVTIKVLNKNKDPIYFKDQIIKWGNRKDVDTITTVDSRFIYYPNGKLKESISYDNQEETERQFYIYKDGALHQKRFSNKAGQYTLEYQNTFW